MRSPEVWNYLRKIKRALRLDKLPPRVRRILVGIVGILILLAGIAMMVLPGPAIIMIPLGLAILSTEFYWARCCLRKFVRLAKDARSRFRRWRAAKEY